MHQFELTYCEYPEQPQYPALHVVVVQQHVSEVSCQKGVDASRRSDEVDVGVEHGGAQRPREDAGYVD